MTRPFPIRFLLLLPLSLAIPGSGDEPTVPGGANPGLPAQAPGQAKAARKALPMGALPQNLTSMFPVGRTFKGVSIPSYSENSLSSVMH
ncbi:MAG: hypothetical protein AAGC68_14780, partial [Verrucomicrobiota bacterium]